MYSRKYLKIKYFVEVFKYKSFYHLNTFKYISRKIGLSLHMMFCFINLKT